jgi:L-threonylcarbamoyladenylate synthase
MRVIRLTERPRSEAVREVVELLKGGGVVAFPTETFYGIGVRYDDRPALARLFSLKGRPEDKAMPLIIGERADLQILSVKVSPLAEVLMNKFWPGPLTLLFEARAGLPDLLTAGTQKVAVRMPGASLALDIARATHFPVTATSANLSGYPPAVSKAEVEGYFGEGLDLIIDGGGTAGGKPSTIVDVSGGKVEIVRYGAVPEEKIRNAL